MKRLSPILLCAFALTSCIRGSSTATPSPTPSSNRPPAATLFARNLIVFPGDDRAIRIAFEPFEDAARVIVNASTTDAPITVCPLAAIDAPLPALAACKRNIGNGVREPISEPGLRALAFRSDSPSQVSFDLVLEFDEVGRDVQIVIPILRPPPGNVDCADNGCNPFFELTPTRGGPFRARATWSGSPAALVLLQGNVLARAQTSSGVPYAEPARALGSSPLAIATKMSAPGEYALAFRHTGTASTQRDLTGIRIDVSWPETER